MDWDRFAERLLPLLRSIVDDARSVYPHILGGASGRTDGGTQAFQALASLTHDPSTRYEDVLVVCRCWANGVMRLGPGGTPLFPDASLDRHVLRAEIERGDGEELAALDPILLDPDPDSAEYERQAMDYAERTVAFIESNRALIFEALADREWQDPGD